MHAPDLTLDCPIRRATAVIGGKWALLIVFELRDGRLRFAELRRQITGISEKMLTQELKKLVAAELIERHDYREVPPRVDYQLTDLGRGAVELVYAIAKFGERLSPVA